MPNIAACRAEHDYNVWLRFDDGLEGTIFLGNLLDLGAFALWRDPRVFQRVHVDRRRRALVWNAGVLLAADVLRADLEVRGVKPPARPVETDPAFLRFMVRAITPAARSLVAREIIARSAKRIAKRRRRAS